MAALWIFMGGIALYIVGTFVEWLGDQVNGGRRRRR